MLCETVAFEIRSEASEKAWGESSKLWDQRVTGGVEETQFVEPYKPF